jgi:mannosyltransferase
MALPKSMRYLAAATLCIFVFLFVQLLHTPKTELLIPSGKPSASQHGQGDRDPQLDRMASMPYVLRYVPC